MPSGSEGCCEATAVEFILPHGEAADNAVAFIAQHRLEKADLQRPAEIEHAEAVRDDAAPRIAKATRRFSISKGIGIAIEIDAAEPLARFHRAKIQTRLGESCRRSDAGHLAEIPSPDAFGRR